MERNEIKAELIRRGIKIGDVARKTGVVSQCVSQVLSGVRKTPHIRQAIADAIGRPVAEVFPDSKEQEP